MENSYQMPPHGDVQVQYDTPQSAKPQSNAGSHQRTYQACIPCRERKVRCDLGPVDNPHDPPCVRCRRESKECYFSKTRRKKKADGEAASDENTATYEIKDGRKRVKVSTDEVENEPYGGDDVPCTPGGSIGMAQPLRRPTGPKAVQYGEEDQKASEETVARLQATEVHGGHDALKLLFEAASSTHNRKGSKESGPRPSFTNGVSPASLPSVGSPTITEKANGSYTSGPMAMLQNDPMWKTNVNPTSNPLESIASIDQEGYNSALKAWSRFRFVRAGWFTAKEAIDYIDYFHRHLSPLTPIVISTYQPYDTHEKLLTTEPMLTVVLLLIASRHMKLEGPGSVSRPYSIHQKLWSYLSGMVNRVLWGQEQFGGGFCGAGAEAASDVNPLTRKGLRTLGTIESLILLTEWHPRAMHFPPDEADEELMVPGEPLFQSTDANAEAAKGIGGQRMDAWLEPCWRSDRLCWMLLGLSMSLAFEIGVFDASEWQRHARSAGGHPLSADEMQAYDLRRSTVKNLLLVYVTQTSGRLGLTSMLPSNYSKPEDSTLFKQQLGQHHSIQEEIVHFWLRMAHLMREGNQRIYANKAFTRDLIKSGDYKTVLESLQEPLRRWREDFDKCGMPKHMRHILEIEYEYCRVYINALALQAVAERCANEQLFQNSSRPVEVNGPAANAIPPQTLAKLLGGDRNYMLQVGDAARNLLKVVVNGLYPGEFLRHAPVRTYFRIISASIVLLKSFSLGASESDVSDSLSLMDKTVEALRGCIVDDVHVASRFADLLDTLTQSLKPRLVRIAADGRSKSRRHSRPGSPEPVHTPLGLADQKLQAHKRKISGSFPTQQQQWPYSNDNMHGLNSTMPPSNSLFGVSNDIYDLTGPDNNFSIMPPPSFVYNSPAASLSQNMNTSPGNTGYDAFNEQDWLALPLDPIINMNGFNQNVDVSQGQFGPDVGGMDMLELLLNGNNANHWQ